MLSTVKGGWVGVKRTAGGEAPDGLFRRTMPPVLLRAAGRGRPAVRLAAVRRGDGREGPVESIADAAGAAEGRPPPLVSVIIPTLEEEGALGATLDAVARLRGPVEVIVVDGGSRDGTLALARGRGAVAVTAARGRGRQLHAGVGAARGAVLWFLHADTLPPADAAERIARALRDPAVVGGNFRLRFGGRRQAARFLTALQPAFAALGLCYGDSAIFVRRAVYDQVGGFRPFPLFEDLDLVHRLRRRGRLAHLRAEVICSPRRFEERGFSLTFARSVGLQLLYWLGVSPHRLGRLYPLIRGKGAP
jgi:rSAM/selenodomain-associated transferase 2